MRGVGDGEVVMGKGAEFGGEMARMGGAEIRGAGAGGVGADEGAFTGLGVEVVLAAVRGGRGIFRSQRFDGVVPVSFGVRIIVDFIDTSLLWDLGIGTSWFSLRLLREEVFSPVLVAHEALHAAGHVDGVRG